MATHLAAWLHQQPNVITSPIKELNVHNQFLDMDLDSHVNYILHTLRDDGTTIHI